MLNVDEKIKNAMKEKNLELLGVLKLVKAEFLKKSTEPGRSSKELTEEEQVKVLMKMVSQRVDSIRQYVDAGRQDLADAEKRELDILGEFIPKQPTDEELAEYVRGVVSEYCASNGDGFVLGMKDMKPIMGIVKGKYPTTNGGIVSKTLKEIIG